MGYSIKSPLLAILLSILLVLVKQQGATGQKRTPSAAWLMPAASWRPANNVRLVAQLGYNNYYRMGIFFPQGFITLNKHVILNPAYIYALQKRPTVPRVWEHYLMNAVIFQVKSSNLLIEDRNMIWNRWTTGIQSRHYYRNRLRINRAFKTWSATTKLYAYDEVFYLFNVKSVVRNRAAFGISSDLNAKWLADVTFVRQQDRYAGPLNLFFIACTWQF
ncbi:hypothetical protein [Paraflavitalea sp. CAU 1676]|uniref:hypothetical protein n=1 Tax=Paraflavitalea sp. CAU 1676 TaxID=3032598 RepID=UPI0023DAE637|nr:hypothetical protein [Paraflavitalea sp. CAU 1676]MDF2187923.1 hypothetical protein [Paraflavitalea sp. CAU 1676]